MPDSQQPQAGVDIMVLYFSENPGLRVVDVGAGMGKWSKLTRHLVGGIDAVEAFQPYISRFSLTDLYDQVYNEDMRTFGFSGGYDVAILGDVLEHIEKPEALIFIEKLKSCVGRIFLTIPISLCIQDGSFYGNEFETHRYQWADDEIQSELGFTMLHSGPNENGLVMIGTYEWHE